LNTECSNRPHYLKRERLESGVYVRVGSTNRRADRELVEELRRFARGEAFDEQPVPDLDSEALDFRAASESFAPGRRIARRDLETLRLVTDHQGRKVPTVGGVLLFGREAGARPPFRERWSLLAPQRTRDWLRPAPAGGAGYPRSSLPEVPRGALGRGADGLRG
jgi:hypothetical protein